MPAAVKGHSSILDARYSMLEVRLMDNKETEKAPIAVSKSFMAVGPTLHYSHKNVQRCWLLAVAAFGVSCFFWSKIATGSFWSFDIEAAARPAF